MTRPTLRARYLADVVATASPGQLLVMLYDRLVLDLVRAEEAQRSGAREVASVQLLHAQEIVLELQVSLAVAAWEGARGLSQLYTFLLTELIAANVGYDADRTASCRGLVEPLRDAWRQAATAAAGRSTAVNVR
jgi:flagellar secretion chaperone FliS